jgi:hypothetical protein
MTISDHKRQNIPHPEDLLSFHVRDTGTNRISLVYLADVLLPKYVEGMIDAVKEEFNAYREMIETDSI